MKEERILEDNFKIYTKFIVTIIEKCDIMEENSG